MNIFLIRNWLFAIKFLHFKDWRLTCYYCIGWGHIVIYPLWVSSCQLTTPFCLFLANLAAGNWSTDVTTFGSLFLDLERKNKYLQYDPILFLNHLGWTLTNEQISVRDFWWSYSKSIFSKIFSNQIKEFQKKLFKYV